VLFAIKILRGLLKGIAGSGEPRHVAFALCLGLFAAFAPLGLLEPMTYVVLLLAIGTRAGLGMTLTSFALFKALTFLFARALTAKLGFFLLEGLGFLKGLWAWALNLPVVALFGLDRYVAMGGLVLGLVLACALYWPLLRGVIWVRERFVKRYENHRLVRWFRSFWFMRAASFAAKRR